MKIDQKKLRELIAKPSLSSAPDQLRREENIFFVGGNLPERETIETLFESHYQSNASLFHLTFGDVNNFHRGEMLAKSIKKNFNTHLVGRFDYAAPQHLIERAYAAGVDILDIPLNVFDRARSSEEGYALDDRLRSLQCALSVFPRWGVVSTLVAGEEPPCSTMAGIEALLSAGILPLVTLSGRAGHYPADRVAAIFDDLCAGWRKKKAVIKPLLPLIYLSSPLAPASPRGVVRGFMDAIDERRLLAASDLRRVLRVKEVAESFESAGL